MTAGPLAAIGLARRTGFSDLRSVGALTAATAFWGASLAAPYAAAAVRHPQRSAIVDDYGVLTYRQLDWRTSRVAGAFRQVGMNSKSTVGILCRNHRGFVEANIAVAKVGARVVYLNTGLPPGQLSEVINNEGISFVIADREFTHRLGEASDGVKVVTSAPEDDNSWSFPELKRYRLPLVRNPWRIPDPILLTSGTSGAPKGTNRSAGPRALTAAVGFLQAVPFRSGTTFVIPAPLFHAWGVSQLIAASTLASTVVLRRTFDPEGVARDVEANSADVLIAVPVMLHRILESETDRDMSSLRIVATSGSALPGDLATRWMESYGDSLYNIYGSTEIGQVSVASPQDLKEVPSTAGRPLKGVNVRILNSFGHAAAPGTIGRIAVKSKTLFDGYTGGGSKEVIDSHMAIGDQGYIDAKGRLFVVGRADDMIISGGENVYPNNIERSLLSHELVSEAAVVGVPDPDFGHKVRAVIVTQDKAASTQVTKKLKAHLSKELAPYEMPREYVYVEHLPRNESGKVLRNKLTEAVGALTK
jgi:acyl-CoA synthetase (AMP-forming)/AMP-acid ligase II